MSLFAPGIGVVSGSEPVTVDILQFTGSLVSVSQSDDTMVVRVGPQAGSGSWQASLGTTFPLDPGWNPDATSSPVYMENSGTSPFFTSSFWFFDAAKTIPYKSWEIIAGGNIFPSQEQWVFYDVSGNYVGGFYDDIKYQSNVFEVERTRSLGLQQPIITSLTPPISMFAGGNSLIGGYYIYPSSSVTVSGSPEVPVGAVSYSLSRNTVTLTSVPSHAFTGSVITKLTAPDYKVASVTTSLVVSANTGVDAYTVTVTSASAFGGGAMPIGTFTVSSSSYAFSFNNGGTVQQPPVSPAVTANGIQRGTVNIMPVLSTGNLYEFHWYNQAGCYTNAVGGAAATFAFGLVESGWNDPSFSTLPKGLYFLPMQLRQPGGDQGTIVISGSNVSKTVFFSPSSPNYGDMYIEITTGITGSWIYLVLNSTIALSASLSDFTGSFSLGEWRSAWVSKNCLVEQTTHYPIGLVTQAFDLYIQNAYYNTYTISQSFNP